MIVCVCKRVSEGQIRQAVAGGAGDLSTLSEMLGVATQCGRCACMARGIIDEVLTDMEQPAPIFHQVA